MPGINSNVDNSKAEEAVVNTVENGESNQAVGEPRQPQNLQGLLRLAMETVPNDNQPSARRLEPIEPERRRWLEDAISSMTVDVVTLLREQITVLQNCKDLKPEDDISKYTQAMETILEYVDNIDFAMDFHKIGGFTTFWPCFQCVHADIRAGICNIIAELCQNSPYCQNKIRIEGMITPLVDILNKDEDKVCVKALYAVSCIVRNNPECLQVFRSYQGINILLKFLRNNEDRLRTKAAFLLSVLCESTPELKYELLQSNYLPTIMSSLTEEIKPSHEHILNLLKEIVENNNTAIIECRKPEYNAEDVLIGYLQRLKDDIDLQYQEDTCVYILDKLFPGTCRVTSSIHSNTSQPTQSAVNTSAGLTNSSQALLLRDALSVDIYPAPLNQTNLTGTTNRP